MSLESWHRKLWTVVRTVASTPLVSGMFLTCRYSCGPPRMGWIKAEVLTVPLPFTVQIPHAGLVLLSLAFTSCCRIDCGLNFFSRFPGLRI